MNYSKSLAVIFTAVVCSTAIVADAGAQARGRSSGGGSPAGHAVPRGAPPQGGVARPIGGPHGPGVAPYHPYYPYRYPYYPYRVGVGFGFGFYGYGYGYPYAYGYPYLYGYPYGYYGYPYGYAYGAYAPVGYVSAGEAGGYGGVRIEGAPHDAQVFADGNYVGVVNDFDGTFQSLDLQAGVHQIEIRSAGQPPISVDVNVTPGQTVTYHANKR